MEEFETKSTEDWGLEGQKLQDDFGRLRNIAEILKGMGLQVIDQSITLDKFRDPAAEMGFPIVRNGANGIRASYSKREGLKIWFTNGFEDPENPKRKEIEERLKEEGLI